MKFSPKWNTARQNDRVQSSALLVDSEARFSTARVSSSEENNAPLAGMIPVQVQSSGLKGRTSFISGTPYKKITEIHELIHDRCHQITWGPPYYWTGIIKFNHFSCWQFVERSTETTYKCLKHGINLGEPFNSLMTFSVKPNLFQNNNICLKIFIFQVWGEAEQPTHEFFIFKR